MANLYKNKIIYGGNVLIDLTSDTVDPAHLLSGYTAHDRSGAIINGTCSFDADTSDGDAIASQILSNKIAYVNGNKITGIMPNNGGVSGTIETLNSAYVVPQGYHDGSGTVNISDTESAKIIAANIKAGVSILGVEGTYAGESITAQSKTVTPSINSQSVLPDSGYDYLSQVTVNAIPYTETDNSAGGITVSIG